MTDSAPRLTPEQRKSLMTTLTSIDILNTEDARSLLLNNLPEALYNGVQRSSIKYLDINNMVNAVATWGYLEDQTLALFVLIDNALEHCNGSAAEIVLNQVKDQIEARIVSSSPTSTITPSSTEAGVLALNFFEKAAYYRELRENVDGKNWQIVLKLAERLSDYLDVPTLVAQAQAELSKAQDLAEEAARAYATSDWDNFIQTVQELGEHAPHDLAVLVARLWRDVPLSIPLLTSDAREVWALAATPDGQHLLASIGNGNLALLDRQTKKEVYKFVAHERPVLALVVTPDGKQVLSGALDGTLLLVDWASGDPICLFNDPEPGLLALTITPDGKWVITSHGSGKLVLWDLQAGIRLKDWGGPNSIVGHRTAVLSLALTPNGDKIFSGAIDGTLKVWDLVDNSDDCMIDLVEAQTLAGPPGEAHTPADPGAPAILDTAILALAVTSDGRYLISGSHDDLIRLWDLETGSLQRMFTGHEGQVFMVATIQNGQYLVSAASDKRIKLWSLESGRLLRTLLHWGEGDRAKDVLLAATLMPDNCTLVTAGEDGDLRFHSLKLPAKIEED